MIKRLYEQDNLLYKDCIGPEVSTKWVIDLKIDAISRAEEIYEQFLDEVQLLKKSTLLKKYFESRTKEKTSHNCDKQISKSAKVQACFLRMEI